MVAVIEPWESNYSRRQSVMALMETFQVDQRVSGQQELAGVEGSMDQMQQAYGEATSLEEGTPYPDADDQDAEGRTNYLTDLYQKAFSEEGLNEAERTDLRFYEMTGTFPSPVDRQKYQIALKFPSLRNTIEG
jgi:hypothetical protein